jgi:hypothetical protein
MTKQRIILWNEIDYDERSPDTPLAEVQRFVLPRSRNYFSSRLEIIILQEKSGSYTASHCPAAATALWGSRRVSSCCRQIRQNALSQPPQRQKDDGEPLKRLSTAETQGGFSRIEAPYYDLKELTLTELAEVYPTTASEGTVNY